MLHFSDFNTYLSICTYTASPNFTLQLVFSYIHRSPVRAPVSIHLKKSPRWSRSKSSAVALTPTFTHVPFLLKVLTYPLLYTGYLNATLMIWNACRGLIRGGNQGFQIGRKWEFTSDVSDKTHGLFFRTPTSKESS